MCLPKRNFSYTNPLPPIRKMKLTTIIILTLILVSCKKQTETNTIVTISEFNLLNDYSDFQNKMTELDTLIVWADLSACTYQGTEKLTISKRNDSIKIESEFSDSFGNGDLIRQKPIVISENDTIWNFGNFLSKNKKRILPISDSESSEFKLPRLYIECDTTKIHFFTNGLGDLHEFMGGYYIAMRNLNPENKNYIFGVEIPLLYEEGEITEPEPPQVTN